MAQGKTGDTNEPRGPRSKQRVVVVANNSELIEERAKLMDAGLVSQVEELWPVKTEEQGRAIDIRRFSLSLNGVTVELSSVGASLTKFLVPSAGSSRDDDIVLGYNSPLEMWSSKNPFYFGAIVGRVANRIAKGEVQMEPEGRVYRVEKNNGPNHLHGGSGGFSNRIWDAAIVDSDIDGKNHPGVRFSLESVDGDQGYPGKVLVSATYSLCADFESSKAARLVLSMNASLVDGEKSPVNLAQHSYFNLSRHDDPSGILDHRLTMPHCNSYTPLDDSSIPTREVRLVTLDPAMDWRHSRLLRVALSDFAVQQEGMAHSEAMANTQKTRIAPNLAKTSAGEPYGFDHNYVVHREEGETMKKVAVVEHSKARRRLTVFADSPGVQLYTANYLDGATTSLGSMKDNACYGQWQGVCLETQHFPSSILVNAKIHPEFAKGACPILTREKPDYEHRVEYLLEYDVTTNENESNDEARAIESFRGSDSNGRRYASVQEMWKKQGVVTGNSTAWYSRAAKYYEENCAPTVDGVLGGFETITDVDLAGSRRFLETVKSMRPSSFEWSLGAACECGAGIGRVSKGLLLPLGVPRSDLVESSSRLLFAAPDFLGDALAGQCRFFCTGLQDWAPKENSYSIIWIQWVLIYLTDDDIVAFLKRCSEALIPQGVIVLKENTCSPDDDDDFVVDLDDASLTRSVDYWKHLCRESGLRLLYEQIQDDFPDDLYPVPMLALVKD